MKIFDLDGPVVRFMNKVADLMILNFWAMICCIPVFTIGASLTALNYMALKIVRDEECYITRGFFKSFKENFRQSTIIWVIILVVAAFLGTDLYIIEKSGLEFGKLLKTVITMFAVMATFTAMMAFPLQAKFDNPVKITLKNAFAVSILQFPKTFAMIILMFLPVAICYISFGLFPVALLFGMSGPAYFSAQLYNVTFKKMERQYERAQEEVKGSESENDATAEDEPEDERIFKDELDESIVTDNRTP